MNRNRRPQTAFGFTVKSGWACAVLLSGPTATPRVVESTRIDLSDPGVPEARQPYHDGFGTPRRPGAARSRLIASVQRYGRRSVTGLIRRAEDDGHRLVGAGIVVGSLIDPETIGNPHIRIHALEGRLFRSVVEEAVALRRVPRSIWRDRDLAAEASARLNSSAPAIRSRLTALGKGVAGGWRAEQKSAALAAWLTLAGARRANPLQTRPAAR